MAIMRNYIACNSKMFHIGMQLQMLEINRYWYQPSLRFITFILLPFSWLFRGCIFIRRQLYRLGFLKTHRFNVPVIIVGNITVGGTGKTPFVIWLAHYLIAQGYRPGIVSRGVGGKRQIKPYRVKQEDAATEVGDEAVLLAQRANCPLVIGIDRVAAVRELLQQAPCDIVISDDGLQHYRLGRDIEIVIIDGSRRFGNNCLLPAGPLREPVSRLQSVDFVVVNGEDMILEPVELLPVIARSEATRQSPDKKAHAVAGIGHPDRFFLTLKQAGFDIIPHAFPDHHPYQP
ncbi:MAG: tetraacyldisaccharide 4'-kinase, partial [Gammaproteobacteria bacterium]